MAERSDEGSARLEVSAVEGPPLKVTQKDGTLTVAYDDLPWKGFLKWLDRKGRRCDVLVSPAVPTGTLVARHPARLSARHRDRQFVCQLPRPVHGLHRCAHHPVHRHPRIPRLLCPF